MGKRGKEISQGKHVILEVAFWSLGPFSAAELTILGMISLCRPACTACLSFCLTVLSTVISLPAKSSQLLMETSCGSFFISCKNRNGLLWLQMPVPYQRFRLSDHFFPKYPSPTVVATNFQWDTNSWLCQLFLMLHKIFSVKPLSSPVCLKDKSSSQKDQGQT